MRLGFKSTFHVAVPNLRRRDSTWVMWVYIGYIIPLIMENQMEKKMENEMETAIYRVM